MNMNVSKGLGYRRPFRRSPRMRATTTLLGGAVLGIVAVGQFGADGVAADTASEGPNVHAHFNGKTIPIREGQVVGQVRKVGGLCQIDSPIGVGGSAKAGEPSYSISWTFDDQCRMIITEIRAVTAADERRLPSRGGKTVPATERTER